MEVLLDTNFIITALKERVDFLEQLQGHGFTVKVPREVIHELKDLRLKVAHTERANIDVALDMLLAQKVKKVSLSKTGVDVGLIAKGKEGVYIATLDNAIRRAVPNKVGLSATTKSIVIERS